MAARIVAHLMEMLFSLVRSLLADKAELALEVVALRQQLAVFKRKKPRPHLDPLDRMFLVALKDQFAAWAEALIIVKPETVVRWHREAFRKHWAKKSARPPGRPETSKEVLALIRKMAEANPTWGAPRVHGELQKLGIEVSERTVPRHMPTSTAPRTRPRNGPRSRSSRHSRARPCRSTSCGTGTACTATASSAASRAWASRK